MSILLNCHGHSLGSWSCDGNADTLIYISGDGHHPLSSSAVGVVSCFHLISIEACHVMGAPFMVMNCHCIDGLSVGHDFCKGWSSMADLSIYQMSFCVSCHPPFLSNSLTSVVIINGRNLLGSLRTHVTGFVGYSNANC